MTTTWGEIIEAGEWEYYGVRWVEESVEVGSTVANSRVWVDNDPTEDKLDGACAIEIRSVDDLDAILATTSYTGRPVLLGSMHMAYGIDAGEIVMTDAIVLAE